MLKYLLYLIVLFFSFGLEAQDDEPPVFDDPFASPEAPSDLVPDVPQESLTPLDPAPVEPNPFTPEPEFLNRETEFPAENLDAPELPTFKAPDPLPEPVAPVEIPPEAETEAPATEAPRAKPFEFPIPETSIGPVSQDVVEREGRERGTSDGTWSLSFYGGAAMNLNKTLNQVDTAIGLGYRFDSDWEIGILPYFRFVRAKLLGGLLTVSRFWQITAPSKFRLEVATGVGAGWAIRSKAIGFNEGRLPFRLFSDFHFYAVPGISIIASAALETHLYGAISGKAQNYFSSGGPPTQLLTNLGIRLEF